VLPLSVRLEEALGCRGRLLTWWRLSRRSLAWRSGREAQRSRLETCPRGVASTAFWARGLRCGLRLLGRARSVSGQLGIVLSPPLVHRVLGLNSLDLVSAVPLALLESASSFPKVLLSA
jgi:hypothetical protein